MKHLIKFAPVAHVAMSVQHKGNDQQYCEAGETVRLNWQPSSGWGLLVAGFRDLNDDGAVVTVIDLSTREFTMPDYDIVIMGEARRYNVEQFRSEGEEGQVLGVGPLGLVVPTNVEMPTYEGNEGDLLYSDGNGGIKAADTARINEEGDLEVDYNINTKHINAEQVIVSANCSAKTLCSGGINNVGKLVLYSPNGTRYEITVDNSGNLVVTPV